MTAPLPLRYLGGCPGHARPEPATVTVADGHFDLQARRWGWRIAYGAVSRVEELQPAPDGDGHILGVVWTPPGEAARTLLLSGTEVARLRFLLAQGAAAARLAAEQPLSPTLPPSPRPRRAPRSAGPWARELRRMRAAGLAAMAAALTALVLVIGVTLFVLGDDGGGRWRRDRDTLRRLSDGARQASDRNDPAALSLALQALVDTCRELEPRNGEAANTGAAFNEVQQICAGAGVMLY